MAGIMDLFSGKKPDQQQQQQTQQQTQNQQQNQNNQQQNNNQQTQNANSAENQGNPLDSYTKIWDNATKKDAITAPSFRLPADKIKEVAATLDFTKGLDPALLEKAKGGDATALLEAISTVGRNAYSTSLEHLTALTDTHLSNRSAYEEARIGDSVRKNLTSNELASTPNYEHPVIKAELNRVASQLASLPENADATPQQIAKMAQKYLNDVYSAMNPDANKQQQIDPATGKPKQKEDFDWSKYLGEASSQAI